MQPKLLELSDHGSDLLFTISGLVICGAFVDVLSLPNPLPFCQMSQAAPVFSRQRRSRQGASLALADPAESWMGELRREWRLPPNSFRIKQGKLRRES